MRLRIALAGELPDDRHIFGQIDLLIGQVSGYFGKRRADAALQMIVSPAYTGGAWNKWNEAHGFPLCAYNMRGRASYAGQCQQTVNMDTPLRSLLGEAICHKADALLLIWNEDAAEMSGAVWELMRIAYDRQTPCIWISSKTWQIYCLWEAYYKKYSPLYLEKFCEPLPDRELKPETVGQKKGKVLAFWEGRSTEYLKKYNADMETCKGGQDRLARTGLERENTAAEGEAVRRMLLDIFNRYDEAAIEFNKRFRAMAYQKSVLPFAAAIFLAVGSYSVSLLGGFFSRIMPGYAANAGMLASALAGACLLVYGCLNYYAYRLSKSGRIRRWQEGYINNRYVAEIFRILICFMPYGVELDLRRMCAGNRQLHMSVRHLADEAEPKELTLDQEHMHYALRHIREMLEDQRLYHEFSIRRYQGVVGHLEKWRKLASYIGFGIALGQGGLQFLSTLSAAFRSYGDGIFSSFLSMLALLVPAWAAYFAAKEQQNLFKFNLDNHRRMLKRIGAMQERVENAMGQGDIPLEIFNVMAGELAEMMLLGDTIGWQKQYMGIDAAKPERKQA